MSDSSDIHAISQAIHQMKTNKLGHIHLTLSMFEDDVTLDYAIALRQSLVKQLQCARIAQAKTVQDLQITDPDIAALLDHA
jgi:hypothetical protein